MTRTLDIESSTGGASYEDEKKKSKRMWVVKKPENSKQKKSPLNFSLDSFFTFNEETGLGSQSADDTASNNYYFNSYGQTGIHEDMLKDDVRTGAYHKAITENRHLFEGKVVLDVGSGTGILSLFAADAGARKVIGIECADIVYVARKIIEKNKKDHIISFIHGKAEDIIDFPEKEGVDVIISEWMGYFLLYESMLDTVLYCRDKWLKKDGILFPDKAHMYVAGCEDAEFMEKKIGFWERVWEFNMKVMCKVVLCEPTVDFIAPQHINTSHAEILRLDLKTSTKKDLDFCAEFQLDVQRKDYVHGLVTWWDCIFSHCSPPLKLSTSPYAYLTHWKQTVMYLEESIVCEYGDRIDGRIAVRKSELNYRDLDIKLGVRLNTNAWRKTFYRLR